MAKRWRPHEDRRLRRLCLAGAPLRAIARELGRSEDAVGARRRALGIEGRRRSPPAWSPLEDALLREAALDELARRLDRCPDALRLHAGRLGLHRPVPRRRWSAAEDAVVRDGYANGLTCVEIAAALAQRTASAVAARARKLGLATYARRWTAADDVSLARVLAVRSIDEAARLLGRTPEAVRRRARKLGIATVGRTQNERGGERWTADEDELLVLHAGLNPAVLAALLGRSDQAIAGRLRRLGLRAGRRRSPHHPSPSNGGLTPGERALIDRELRDRGPRALLSLEDRLDRPLGVIADVARASQKLTQASHERR